MNEEIRNIHPQSGFHERLANSIIRKYIITNPKPYKIDDIIRKYSRLHYTKYKKFLVIYSVKLIKPSNQVQVKCIRRQFLCPFNQLCINDHSFFSKIKIIKEQLYSQILELGISFVSLFKDMTFDYYLTRPKSMLEWKLCAMFDKNPEIVYSFGCKRYNHPLFREINEIYID